MSSQSYNGKKNDDVLVSFLETSKLLMDLIRIETDILECSGQFTLEGFWKKKSDLLKSFEDQALNILDVVRNDFCDSPDKSLLLNEIQSIRSALQNNTQYHLKSLSTHLHAYSDMKKLTDEASSWH